MSAIMIANEDGDIVKQKKYEAFGNLVWADGTYDDNREFTGKEKDPTGFHYFVARYYSGDIGRFLSPDPALLLPSGLKLANPQNLNSYIYCVNNPLRYIDPDGREIILIGSNHSFDLYYLLKWLMNDGSSTTTDANRLSYDESGNLVINKEGYTRGSNKALDWLIDIDDSETKIGFAVSLNPITKKDLVEGGGGAVSNYGGAIVPTCRYHWFKGETRILPNGSTFALDSRPGLHKGFPPAGFDGTVSISNEVYWTSKGASYNRLGQIVGHEMVEIFLRSHGEGMSQPAAHTITQEKHYPTPKLQAYPHNAP